MNISKSLKNLFRLLILTAAVTILALPRAHAILNISKYDGLADLEADFDREVEELQVILESQPNGNLEHIGLSHLRNIVSARHLDFFFFQIYGRPFSRKKVQFYRQVDQIVTKHDDRLIQLLRDNYDRFEHRDQGNADSMLTAMTAEYGGILERVPEPDPEAVDDDTYQEQRAEYFWFQVEEALYSRDYAAARDLLEREEAEELVEDPAGRFLTLGAIYFHDQDYQLAARYLEEAVPHVCAESCGMFSRRQHDVAAALVYIYEDQLNDPDKTAKYYELQYKGRPDNPHLLNCYAYFLLEKKDDPVKARPLAEEALEKEPENPHILDTYGYLLYKEGKMEEAAGYFRRALEKDGLSPNAVEVIEGHLRETGR